jgi:hypothetical protein
MTNDYESLVEPVIFWLWNDTPTEEDICRRLDEYRDKGIRAINLHPMPDDFRHGEFYGGLRIPYLSDEYFTLVAFTCQEMKRRRMALWLYDEGGWPSGSANGAVVRENSRFGAWALKRCGQEFHPIQFLEQHSYPDLMNAAATQCFMRHTHEKYKAHIGSEFGKTIKGIFTDEPRWMGRVGSEMIPWSPVLPEAFQKHHGHALETILPHLFSDAASEITDAVTQEIVRARRDYLQSVSTLTAQNYYAVIAKWCEENGLLFEGHHSGEDEWSNHGQYFGHFLQQARSYDLPGVDAIWRQVFPGAGGGNYIGLASSSSWLQGKRVALSECGAVYGAGLTLEQLRWITAFHIVRGVNKLAFMASLQSTRGARRISLCAADLSLSSPLWSNSDLLFDFVRRAAQFSVSGKAQPRVGVFYRSELTSLDESAAFDQTHEALCERLHDAMGGVLFIGIDKLKTASVKNGLIHIGGMQLSLLAIHADAPLDCAEQHVLRQLVDGGGRILWVGNRGSWNDFRDDVLEKTKTHRAQWIESPGAEEFANIVREISPFELDGDLRGVRVLPLQDEERSRFLLFNQNPHRVSFDFCLKDGKELREVVLEEKVGDEDSFFQDVSGRYHMTMQAGELRALETLLPAEMAASEQNIHQLRAELQEEISLQSWDVVQSQNFVIRDEIEIEASGEVMHALPLGDYSRINPHFSGTLLFETTFDFEPTARERVLLDLGQVFYCATVNLNGHDCGRRAWSPFLFDITKALLEGENRLQVYVTNTLANQWAKPDVREHDFKRCRNMYLEKSASFIDQSCHAGLHGPVKVQVFKKTE